VNALSDGKLTGGCLCGDLRYILRPGFRMKPYACHCSDCQRRTGSAFSLHMTVMKTDIEIDGDTDAAHFVQPSGANSIITGCSKCRARIYATNDQRPGLVTLRLGTLDRAQEVTPAVHLWVQSKQPWVTLPGDAQCLDTQPTSPQEWLDLLGP